jgi:CheY-like chemotaxis protein
MSFRDAGYTVTATDELDVARTLLEEVRPAFILADLDHTHGTGIDFCAELRRSPAHRDAVILAMTQRDDLALRVKAVDLQIFDFFKKPVLVGEIVTRLRTLSNRAQYSTILRASSRSKLEGELGETTPYDLLSTIARGGRSAVLTCGTALGPFFCWFTEGELTDAQLGHLHGDDSVHAFLGERRGHYEIEFREVHRARSVSDSLPSILEAALERIASWNELLETLPPMESVLQPGESRFESNELEQDPLVRELARRAEKRATVASLLQAEQPRDLARAAALSKMYFYGLVEVTEEEPGEEVDDDSLTSLERWEEDHLAADSGLLDEEAPIREPARSAAISTKSDLPPAPDFVAGVGDVHDAADDDDDDAHPGVEDEEAAAPTTGSGSYVDVDAVPAARTAPDPRRTSNDASYVDVDHIGSGPLPAEAVPQSQLETVRDAIRRSQMVDFDAVDSFAAARPDAGAALESEIPSDNITARDPVEHLGNRADAILDDGDDVPLVATHTDPYPPEEGDLADFSGLNDPRGLEHSDSPLEEFSVFGASAPVLTGPTAEESMVGFALPQDEFEPAVRGTTRSRSESGELHDQRSDGSSHLAAPEHGAVKINRAGALSESRPLEVDISHASPSGLSGRTLAESGADFDRLRTMAGIETDTVHIRAGHRPAYESMREGVVSEHASSTEELSEQTTSEDDPASASSVPRKTARTRVGLPPPSAAPAVQPQADGSSPAPSASSGGAAIPRALSTGEESASISMYDMVSRAPSWWARRWTWLVFGGATVVALVLLTGLIEADLGTDVADDATEGGDLAKAQASTDAPATTTDAAATTRRPPASPDFETTSTRGGTSGADARDPETTGTSPSGSAPLSGTSTGDAGEIDHTDGTSSTAGAPELEAPDEDAETTAARSPGEEAPEPLAAAPTPEVAPTPAETPSTEGSAGEEPSAKQASGHFDSATRLFDHGKYSRAQEEIERALELDGGWSEAILLSAKIYLELGQFQEAMAVARRVTLVAPALVEAHIIIGVAEEALGSKQGAVAAYERFLLIAPTHPYVTSIRKELKRLRAEPTP